MSQTPHLLVEHTDGITTLTLNHPAQRNALSLTLMQALTDALLQVGQSRSRGVILAAQGPVFSAGHHFAEMAGADAATLDHLFAVCTRLMQTLQAIPQPVVAQVHALATAAGCQLVASCDLAVAADCAAFALPGGKAGLFCHTPLVAVARNIGRKRALEMALTGDPIDAATAADWGLVNQVVPAAQLASATRALIERASRGSVLSKALGKQTFYEQIDLPQGAAYTLASARMAQAAALPDAQEGMTAFLEKRPPQYRQWPGDDSR